MENTPESAAPVAAAKSGGLISSKLALTCGILSLVTIIVALIIIVIFLVLRGSAPAGTGTPTTPTGSVPPVTEVKHGWVATYTVQPTSSTREHYILRSSAPTTPVKLSLSGMSGATSIYQVVAEDMLLVSDCAGTYGDGLCDLYKYSLTTNTGEKVVSGAKAIGAAHLLKNGNIVYVNFADYKYSLNFVKAGSTSNLISKGDTVGRGGSFNDSRGIFATPDDSYFVAVDTVGSYEGTNNIFTIYDKDGTKFAELCSMTTTLQCYGPVMTNEAMYYVTTKSGAKEFHKYTFATKSDVVVATSYGINPELSPDGSKIAFWTTGDAAPYVNVSVLNLGTSVVTSLAKAYTSPVWLDNSSMIVQLSKPVEGIYPFGYAGLAIVDGSGALIKTLEDGTAFSSGAVRVLNF